MYALPRVVVTIARTVSWEARIRGRFARVIVQFLTYTYFLLIASKSLAQVNLGAVFQARYEARIMLRPTTSH